MCVYSKRSLHIISKRFLLIIPKRYQHIFKRGRYISKREIDFSMCVYTKRDRRIMTQQRPWYIQQRPERVKKRPSHVFSHVFIKRDLGITPKRDLDISKRVLHKSERDLHTYFNLCLCQNRPSLGVFWVRSGFVESSICVCLDQWWWMRDVLVTMCFAFMV